ncbi:MAG: hypothetical protein M0P13_04830, partial [Fibrobacteraceae bacterium]|nr:hypothetical protein [Fibrobacteraceae bacterium]
MKRISYLVLLFALSLFAATEGTIASPRYADGQVHLGLPGWVDMSDAESSVLSGSVPGTTDNTTLIALDNDHVITYEGKTYSALSVYPDGRIALGNVNVNLDDGLVPYVRPVKSMVNLTSSFKWKLFSEDLGNHIDHYTAIQLGPFSFQDDIYTQYLCQILFYSDGEIQVQLWSMGSLSWIAAEPTTNRRTLPEWSEKMAPSFYDGHRIRVIPDERVAKDWTQVLYGAEGLRPGWIGKSFKTDAVSIHEDTEPYRNLVVDFGTIKDAGGLLAYDNSREHPVVGSFYGLDIITKTVTKLGTPVYFWYFNEIDGTYYNKYPSIKDGVSARSWVSELKEYLDQINLFSSPAQSSLSYSVYPSDYAYSWDKLGPWNFSGNDDLIEFRPAPAVKFQVVGTPPVDTKFSIISIRYYLKQQQSVQFLPPKPPY